MSSLPATTTTPYSLASAHAPPSLDLPAQKATFLTLGSECTLAQFSQTHRLLSKIRESLAKEDARFIQGHFESVRNRVVAYFVWRLPRPTSDRLAQRVAELPFHSYLSTNPLVCLSDFLPSTKEYFAWGLTGTEEETKDKLGFHIPALRADMCRVFEETFLGTPNPNKLRLRALLSTLVIVTYSHESCHAFLRVSLSDILVSAGVPSNWRTPTMGGDRFGESGFELEALLFGGTLLVLWAEVNFGNFREIQKVYFTNNINPVNSSRLRVISPNMLMEFHEAVSDQGLTPFAAITLGTPPEHVDDISKAEVEQGGILARLLTTPDGYQSRSVFPDPMPFQMDSVVDVGDEATSWGGACRADRILRPHS
ncbi:hypothetical protein DFH09DRAFT_1365355 [Mycena vulgaris]|nr:hypothetical protein DFH09DRAFT_1365355 [Mycena vulgaris]